MCHNIILAQPDVHKDIQLLHAGATKAVHVCSVYLLCHKERIAGAAPGSWSYHLAQHARMVVAIDPAELSPELLLPNVHHLMCKSEVAGEQVQALLGGGKADLLVADMNQHPDTTVEAIKPLLSFVKAGGTIVMTMKFYGLGRDRAAVYARTIDAFGDVIEESSVKAVWLMANTVNERTFIAKRSSMVTT